MCKIFSGHPVTFQGELAGKDISGRTIATQPWGSACRPFGPQTATFCG